MKRLLALSALLFAMALPLMAQGQRLSDDDQQRFDSYYSRWLDYKRTNNRDEIVSMEKRMQDIYDHYNIPDDVPYRRIANGGGREERWHDRSQYGDRDHDSWRHDHDHDRGWHNRLSERDQRRFDSYYSRWLDYKRTNNRDQIVSMEKRMMSIYRTYQIPNNVSFDDVASRR